MTTEWVPVKVTKETGQHCGWLVLAYDGMQHSAHCNLSPEDGTNILAAYGVMKRENGELFIDRWGMRSRGLAIIRDVDQINLDYCARSCARSKEIKNPLTTFVDYFVDSGFERSELEAIPAWLWKCVFARLLEEVSNRVELDDILTDGQVKIETYDLADAEVKWALALLKKGVA